MSATNHRKVHYVVMYINIIRKINNNNIMVIINKFDETWPSRNRVMATSSQNKELAITRFPFDRF